MTLAFVVPLMFATCDLGEVFSKPDAWVTSAVDFAAEHRNDGFRFASRKQDIVNCMGRGKCTWHGLEVWEARVYFGTDGATRVEMSMYNRGDDRSHDGLGADELQKLLDSIAAGAQPGGKIGSGTDRQKLRTGGFRMSKRWTSGYCNIELDWGVDGAKKENLTADFVRVTMYPKGASKPKKIPKEGVAGLVSSKKIKANVRKNSEGDVWIDNVPMVDQGQKGYCAAATSERILRYYGFAVDEHEIAQSAGTTARGGTSIAGMVETVRTVGQRCRLAFVSLVSSGTDMKSVERDLELYNRAAKSEGARELSIEQFTRGRTINLGELYAAQDPKIVKKARMKDARYGKFLKDVKDQVNKGIPVIWGVTLGRYPEPGLPQTAGGHMRMIIGYNAKTKEILYTDSWGSGHELKRMPQDWAFAITNDAFFLKPQ